MPRPGPPQCVPCPPLAPAGGRGAGTAPGETSSIFQREDAMSERRSAVAGSILQRIEAGEAVCGVVGLGYVGLPLSVELARAGYRVLGFDVSPEVVTGVNQGRSHIQ